MFILTLKVVPLLIDSISIGLRSMKDSSLLLSLLLAFVLILLALFVLVCIGKGGGGGGGTGIFKLTLEGGAGGGGGGGGGKIGAEVITGGGGLEGMVLLGCETLGETFGSVLADNIDGILDDAEDALKRFGGKGGALRA